MSAPENPSAFPEVPGDCNAYEGRPGMTLRDWFAGQALANFYTQNDADSGKVANWAYRLADAMLAERAKVRT